VSIEIERTFLVRGEEWKTWSKPVLLRQGYLSSAPERVVRVRIEGDEAMLTIKGRNVGAARNEWEYPIPIKDASVLLDQLCEQPLIEKYRYRIEYRGFIWEIDEFFGENTGLVVAEIELQSEDQAFDKPDWIGDEVTHDPRYFNANLIRHPYRNWQE